MKNKKIKRLLYSFLILVILGVSINLFCSLRLMGNYYTSYYGETTSYNFNFNNYTSMNALYKFKVYFNKIKIFGQTYDYTLTNDELCLLDRKDVYKCYYRDKETAYKHDQYYEISNTYFKTLADDDGWYYSNDKLYAYFGNDKEVKIPKHIKEIAGTAFSSDFERGLNLEKVIIPKTIKSIATSSFSYTLAKEIVIEEGVEEIKRLAFYNSQINKIYLPNSIKKIEFGILDTDFGQKDLQIHCYKNSYACNYLENNKPSGNVKIIYR